MVRFFVEHCLEKNKLVITRFFQVMKGMFVRMKTNHFTDLPLPMLFVSQRGLSVVKCSVAVPKKNPQFTPKCRVE